MIFISLGILIAGLLGGDAAGPSLTLESRERLGDVVEDDERREAADEVMSDAEALLQSNVGDHVARIEETRRLARDRSTSAADFEALTNQVEQARTDAQLIDLRFRLRSTLTREEWTVLFPSPDAAPAAE